MACEFGVLAVLGRRAGRRPLKRRASAGRGIYVATPTAVTQSRMCYQLLGAPYLLVSGINVPESERVPLVSQAASAGFYELK
jgi:hypothetical protein